MSNYWLKSDWDFFIFQTTFGKNEYDLPLDCENIKTVTAINGQSISWFQQSRRKITLIPTPTTNSRVVVKFSTK